MKSSLWILAAGLIVAGCGPKSEPKTAETDGKTTPPTSTDQKGGSAPTDSKTDKTGSVAQTPPVDKAPSSGVPKDTPKSTPMPSGDTYTLKVNPQPGEKLGYLTVYTLTQGDQSRPMKVNETVKISKGSGDQFKIVTTVDDLDIGKEIPAKAKAQFSHYKSVLVVDALNKSIKNTVTGSPMMRDLIGRIGGNPTEGIVFPDHAVKIGDTWSAAVTPNSKVPSEFKLTKVEDSGGKKIAVIESTTAQPDGQKPLLVVFRVDTSDGLLVGQSVKLEAKTKGGVPVTMTLELSRK